ncbi:MAG TPA: hypothetical protein VJT08_01060 [Terriglobales bacterium]|nr:hypothetical protein [Terriglobales bacterium]
MQGTSASTRERLHIDVRPCGDNQSLAGYPKHAKDEAHARILAEEAIAEVLQVADPGEYFVVVSQNGQKPVSTQVVVVPNKPS